MVTSKTNTHLNGILLEGTLPGTLANQQIITPKTSRSGRDSTVLARMLSRSPRYPIRTQGGLEDCLRFVKTVPTWASQDPLTWAEELPG